MFLSKNFEAILVIHSTYVGPHTVKQASEKSTCD